MLRGHYHHRFSRGFCAANLGKLVIISLAGIMVAAGAGCGGVNVEADSSATDSATSDTVRYALWSNPNGQFNPLIYFTDYDRAIVFSIYGRLLTLGSEQDYQPSLATSYDWSDDGKELTFKLRDDVTWHDGQNFTSADVQFTYTSAAAKDYPLDPPLLVQYLKGYQDFHDGKTADFPGITVPDDYTVVFNFETPYSGALTTFTDKPVLAKHVWEGTDVAQWTKATDLLQHPVGTGPYTFNKFVDGQYVELDANPNYFGGKPKTEKLIFKVISPDTLQTAVINNEVDIAEISSWNDKELQTYKDEGINIVETEGSGGQYLSLDTKNPNLADKRVRQAIEYAINRKGLIDSLLYGHGVTFDAQAHPSDPSYPDDLNTYEYSASKAKELLEEAGWTDTDGDGILDKNGEKFTFTLNFPTGNKTRELSAPIIQTNLQDVGIDVKLSEADFNTTLAILQDPDQRYDGVLMGGTFRPGQYGGSDWWARWGDEGDVKDALDKANSTTDPSEQKQAVGAYLKLENDEVPFVPLYIPNNGTAVRPGVQGFERSTYEIFDKVGDWQVSK